MKTIQIIFILLATISCNKINKNTFDSHVQIITKYQTLDENISPNHIKCSEEVKYFEEMNPYDCSFRLENFEFDIEEKFILDKNGNVKEYWTYKSEGPVIYKHHELKSDSKFLKYIGDAELNIRLLENKNQIVDKEDTLTIEKIFPDEKLILMKKQGYAKKKGRRILFIYK